VINNKKIKHKMALERPVFGDGTLIEVNEYRRVVTDGVARYEYNSKIVGQETLISPTQIVKARNIGTGYDVTEPSKPQSIRIFQLSLTNGTRLIVDLRAIENLQDKYSILTEEVDTYIDQRVSGVTMPIKSRDTQLINSQVAVISIAAGGGVYYESIGAKPSFLFIATLIDGAKIRVDSNGKATLSGIGGGDQFPA
jgi:hypothetical protein